jgi:hypothetical protein
MEKLTHFERQENDDPQVEQFKDSMTCKSSKMEKLTHFA